MLEYKNNELFFNKKSILEIDSIISSKKFKTYSLVFSSLISFNFLFKWIGRFLLFFVTNKITFLIPLLFNKINKLITFVFDSIYKIKFFQKFGYKKYLIHKFSKNEIGNSYYLYSEERIVENFKSLQYSLLHKIEPMGFDAKICFSVKSCSNLQILRILKNHNSGADVVSGGELIRALSAGISTKNIVFAGVGKTKSEIIFAIKQGILQINVESFEEIYDIQSICEDLKTNANICLRLNPDVDAKTHGNITTGKKDNKFGVDIDIAYQKLDEILKKCKNLNLVGFSTHIGSQIVEQKPLEDVFCKLADFFCFFSKLGYNLQTIDFGGGLGIMYDSEVVLPLENYTSAIASACQKIRSDINISKMPLVILEPGRFIVANAGVLVTKVVRFKQTETKNFVIVNAAMNDLIRPALYGGYHKMYPSKIYSFKDDKCTNSVKVDIVGPICESSCCFSKDQIYNTSFKSGDLVVFANSGAYGFSMSSRYNTRPLLGEYLLKKDGSILQITKPESYYDILSKELF
jgi:diaminopimelate decarboxylase